LTETIFNGEEEVLKQTYNVQPAIMATSIAILKVLESLAGKKINQMCYISAGHSLGEYTALCAAKSISLEETAKILKARGKYMESASSSTEKGCMYALIGTTQEDVKKMCHILSRDGICEIANDNGNGQFVISGQCQVFTKIDEISKRFSVRRVVLLPVSHAFHSSMMKKATNEMLEELKKFDFQLPVVKIIANYSANIYQSIKEIKTLLIKQIEGKVRWREIIDKMHTEHNVRRFVEIGPGKVLTNIIKRDYKDTIVYNLDTLKNIENYLKDL